MRSFRIFLIAAIVVSSLPGFAFAQISSGGDPVSFQNRLQQNVPTLTMPQVDVATLLAEDERDGKLGIPFRFGFPHDVSYNLDNSGVWETLGDGSRVWRLAIKCPGAFSINIVYDRYRLAEGARFYLYTEDRKMVLGAFTSGNNKQHGKFATAPTRGDKVILEYYLPAGCDDRGELSIGRIVHGYKDIFFGRPKDEIDPTEHFGYSDFCEINVNCPEGEPWQNEVRAVVMTIIDGATRQCSGVMINNVREDLTPYLLTAGHCTGGEDTWLVVFNYQSPTCENIVGPGDMTVSGVTMIAYTYDDSLDFALVELSTPPPPSYGVHYSGWSILDEAWTSSVCIHHPQGDIKKISFDYDTTVETSRLGVTGDGYWRIIEWDAGATEGGSSGAPLYDPEHRIRGQLHGGYSSCRRHQSDWFEQFSRSWDFGTTPQTRLKDWLDPDNTGTPVLDGLDAPCCVGLSGNADGDPEDLADLMDLIYLGEWLFSEGPEPPCREEADANGDGFVDLMDLIYLSEWLFNAGPDPVACP